MGKITIRGAVVEPFHSQSRPAPKPPTRPLPPSRHLPIDQKFSEGDLKQYQFAGVRAGINEDSITTQVQRDAKHKEEQELFEKEFKCWFKALHKCSEVVVEYRNYEKFRYGSVYWDGLDVIVPKQRTTWPDVLGDLQDGCGGFQKPCGSMASSCDGLAFANCQRALNAAFSNVTGDELLEAWGDNTTRLATFKSDATGPMPNNSYIFGLFAVLLLLQFFGF